MHAHEQEKTQRPVRTSSSTEWISCASVGSAGRTCSKLGCGFPLQKLDSVHVALRSIDSFDLSVSCWRSGPMAPCWRTKSRHTGESPAMFPKAHTCFGSIQDKRKNDREKGARGRNHLLGTGAVSHLLLHPPYVPTNCDLTEAKAMFSRCRAAAGKTMIKTPSTLSLFVIQY